MDWMLIWALTATVATGGLIVLWRGAEREIKENADELYRARIGLTTRDRDVDYWIGRAIEHSHDVMAEQVKLEKIRKVLDGEE